MRGTMLDTARGNWRLRVFVGRDAGGRMHHDNRTLAGTKRQAQKELAGMVADVERSFLVSAHRGTLADVIDGWLEAIATDRSRYTLRGHRCLR